MEFNEKTNRFNVTARGKTIKKKKKKSKHKKSDREKLTCSLEKNRKEISDEEKLVQDGVIDRIHIDMSTVTIVEDARTNFFQGNESTLCYSRSR